MRNQAFGIEEGADDGPAVLGSDVVARVIKLVVAVGLLDLVFVVVQVPGLHLCGFELDLPSEGAKEGVADTVNSSSSVYEPR